MPETGFASSIPRFDHGKPKDWFTARFLKNHVAINVSTGKRKAEETFLRRKAVGIPQACHELEAFARPHRIRIDLTIWPSGPGEGAGGSRPWSGRSG